MKLKSIVLAAGLIAVPALAFAQSSPAPNNQSGPAVSPTVQAPTDQGSGNVTGNSKATPERRTSMKPGMKASKAKSKAMTTGSKAKRNASPASPAEGIKKER